MVTWLALWRLKGIMREMPVQYWQLPNLSTRGPAYPMYWNMAGWQLTGRATIYGALPCLDCALLRCYWCLMFTRSACLCMIYKDTLCPPLRLRSSDWRGSYRRRHLLAYLPYQLPFTSYHQPWTLDKRMSDCRTGRRTPEIDRRHSISNQDAKAKESTTTRMATWIASKHQRDSTRAQTWPMLTGKEQTEFYGANLSREKDKSREPSFAIERWLNEESTEDLNIRLMMNEEHWSKPTVKGNGDSAQK